MEYNRKGKQIKMPRHIRKSKNVHYKDINRIHGVYGPEGKLNF